MKIGIRRAGPVAAGLVAGLSLLTGPAFAQTDVPSSSGNGKLVPGATASPTGESLSTKLSNSDGVIKPKTDIDPGMKVPAPVPHPNSTPVIPPSATGGNTAK